MTITTPGALVRYRKRKWVVLSSDDPNLILLRPIGGSAREVCGVVKPLAELMAYEVPARAHRAGPVPAAVAEESQDHWRCGCCWNRRYCSWALARRRFARQAICCRCDQGPTGSCRRWMMHRPPIVRLLIANDVGVSKTIGVALIARGGATWPVLRVLGSQHVPSVTNFV
jgi:hypothetical protein